MRSRFIGYGIFALAINAYLYFRGGWMPILLISGVMSLIASCFMGGDDMTG